ncbi:hypothetical protein [Ilyomonas limi]|uniref:hypothetical protein n=1 Tax=Ilyomonas limi TaxID=2575867 RepID=UPI001485AA32|nr:hypothetical protein [Ilyomonas limi]
MQKSLKCLFPMFIKDGYSKKEFFYQGDFKEPPFSSPSRCAVLIPRKMADDNRDIT